MTSDPRLRRLVPDLVGLFEADRRFFRRRPERMHRLRLAGRAEIEEARVKFGAMVHPAAPSVRAFCAVRRTGPGQTCRMIGFALDCGETDFDEATSRAAYARLQYQDVTRQPNPVALWRAMPSCLGARDD